MIRGCWQIPALPANSLLGAGATLRKRITARATAKPVRRRAVPIRSAAAMFRIVRQLLLPRRRCYVRSIADMIVLLLRLMQFS